MIRIDYKGPVFTDAIICDMAFYMPIPKSASKKKRTQMIEGTVLPIGTPDISNMRKFAEDLLQGICYANDSIIVAGMTKKLYDENPRTEVSLRSAYPC